MNGIYVLANDHAKEWLVAWFESVRAKGCTLPICILAFDDQIAQVSRIAAKHGAEIWQSDWFPTLDRIGLGMTGRVTHGHFYRKLAIFDGPFESFLYADSDMLALMNWDELVARFDSLDADLWYCGLSADWVYKPGSLWDDLKRRNRALCMNAGLLLARKRRLTLVEIKALSERTLAVRDQFQDPGDQGFINYWIDHSNLKVQAVSEVMPDVHNWNWAGSTYFTGKTDMFEVADKTGFFEGKRFAMIHWAGFGVRSSMPNRKLFLKYRLAHASPGDRLYYEWVWGVRPMFGNAKRKLQARFWN